MGKKKSGEDLVLEDGYENEDLDRSSSGDVVEGMTQERDPDTVMTEDVPKNMEKSIEKQVTQMGKQTAEKLRQYPQEKVLIPVDKLNKHIQDVVVGINGWNFQIQRNVPVELPSPVVDLLERAGYAPTRVR